jgi:TPR repeat protein
MYGAQLADGDGVKRDVKKGLKVLAKSCETMRSPQGCAMYARGLVLGAQGKDGMKKGAQIAEAVCMQGDPMSCVLAGMAYLEGRGVDRDRERGTRFVLVACSAGYEPACKLKQRLPAGMVKKVEEEVSKANASGSAAPPTASGAPPAGLGPFPGLAP